MLSEVSFSSYRKMLCDEGLPKSCQNVAKLCYMRISLPGLPGRVNFLLCKTTHFLRRLAVQLRRDVPLLGHLCARSLSAAAASGASHPLRSTHAPPRNNCLPPIRTLDDLLFRIFKYPHYCLIWENFAEFFQKSWKVC